MIPKIMFKYLLRNRLFLYFLCNIYVNKNSFICQVNVSLRPLLSKRGYRARNLNEGQYQFLEKYQFEDNASLSKFTSVSDIK